MQIENDGYGSGSAIQVRRLRLLSLWSTYAIARLVLVDAGMAAVHPHTELCTPIPTLCCCRTWWMV
jgi:hypothetical protein